MDVIEDRAVGLEEPKDVVGARRLRNAAAELLRTELKMGTLASQQRAAPRAQLAPGPPSVPSRSTVRGSPAPSALLPE
eukprot:6650839-Prymnesium_polylepis.1